MSEGSKHVFNLCNSIIGVSLLAMPFCFKRCGIILGIVMVLASGFLTRFTSHLLMKASLLCRKSNYEVLAFHAYGSLGKFTVEAGVICFMLGVLVSFFVIIGDIAPAIVQELSGIESFPALRTVVLTAVGLAVGLPLGLLRNISSLGPISTIAMTFYAFLTIKIIVDALPVLASEGWAESVLWWEPEGILVCMPIFSLALACQTQLFEVYEVLPEPSLGKMNKLVRQAVNICACGYIAVGFFGYIAFYNTDFTGNILMAMQPSLVSQLIKLAFAASVVCSMPLVVFPCRTSLYSLLYRRQYAPIELGGSHSTSDVHFRAMTALIVVSTLIMGIMFPNIELVLELNGSTIGTIICLIIPTLLFIRVTSRNTFERTGAQVVCCIGVFILVVCTYVTLRHAVQPKELSKVAENVIAEPLPEETRHLQPLPSLGPDLPELRLKSEGPALKVLKPEQDSVKLKNVNELPKVDKAEQEKSIEKAKEVHDVRQEPPIPQEPEVVKVVKEVKDVKEVKEREEAKEVKEVEKEVVKPEDAKKDQLKPEEPKAAIQNKPVPDGSEQQANQLKQANEQKQVDVGAKQEELLQKLQAQQEEQKQLIQQQKQLLEELKAHKDTHFKDVPPSPISDKAKDKSPVLPNIVLEPGGAAVQKLADVQLKGTAPAPIKNIEERQANSEITVGSEKVKLNPDIKLVPPTPLEERPSELNNQKNIIPQQPFPPSIKQDKEGEHVDKQVPLKELPAPTVKQDLLVTIVKAMNTSNKAADQPPHVPAQSVLKLGLPAEQQVVKEVLGIEHNWKQDGDVHKLEPIPAADSKKDNGESGAAMPQQQLPDKRAEIRKREAIFPDVVKQLPETDDKCERSTEPPYGCQPPDQTRLAQPKEGSVNKPAEVHSAADHNENAHIKTNKSDKPSNTTNVKDSQQQTLKVPLQQERNSNIPSKVHSSDGAELDPRNKVVPSSVVETDKLKLAAEVPTPVHRLLAKDEQR